MGRDGQGENKRTKRENRAKTAPRGRVEQERKAGKGDKAPGLEKFSSRQWNENSRGETQVLREPGQWCFCMLIGTTVNLIVNLIVVSCLTRMLGTKF